MAVNLAGDRLPCGHDIDQLWDHLAKDTPDEHARSCEYCQAALNEIRPLRTATSELAAEPVRPPADLSGKVMAAVRARMAAAPASPCPARRETCCSSASAPPPSSCAPPATPSTAYAPEAAGYTGRA